MNKEQKVNWIKCWLQKFGNRDNETFNKQITINGITWELSLQYDFDFDGEKLEPYDWCSNNFKQIHNNRIQDKSNEELNEIINKLNSIQTYY
jgi:hypothetical protein